MSRQMWAAALTGLLLLGTAGCGIRSTSVPVDAGAAPSRVPCEVPTPGPSDQPSAGTDAKVYLVCSSQLVPVQRTVRVPDDRATDHQQVARALLRELQGTPTAAAVRAGFITEVPDDLRIAPEQKGDPDGALRLSRAPDELRSYALAQIVCTYAETAAVGELRLVVLGGPDSGQLWSYECTEELKSHPDTVQASGTAVS